MDAMRGVQRAYYCPPYHPFVIQSASAFAVAVRETGLEQIVGLSQWLAGPNHPALMTRQQWLYRPDVRCAAQHRAHRRYSRFLR
jgi:NAD(P)H dehydrogenase (quinone)